MALQPSVFVEMAARGIRTLRRVPAQRSFSSLATALAVASNQARFCFGMRLMYF
jgi:hypothetical protein